MTEKKDFIIKDKRMFAEGSEDQKVDKQKAEPESEKPKEKVPEEKAETEKEGPEYLYFFFKSFRAGAFGRCGGPCHRKKGKEFAHCQTNNRYSGHVGRKNKREFNQRRGKNAQKYAL